MGPMIHSNILYLGQIPYDWDENTVGSVVYGSGDIVDIRLGFDHVGKNKGFCFVEYRTVQDAERAMPLLLQILIFSNNRTKKLRIESSKEGFKANHVPAQTRPSMLLNRSRLPPYVKLPEQMLLNGRNDSPQQSGQSMGAGNMPPYSQQQTPQQQLFQSFQQLFQLPYQRSFPSFQQTPPPPPSQVPMPSQSVPISGSPNRQMPPKLLHASQNLPHDPNFQLDTPDNINITLSKIPPPQLIEIIAQMKNLVEADPSRVQDFFQSNSQLALPVAQALLLMGFIDHEVIMESLKSSSSTPQPQYAQTSYQKPQYQANANNNPYRNNGQQYQQQQQQQQQLPPPPQHQQQQQNLQIMQNPAWQKLPPEVQYKLLSLPAEQVPLAVQILSISPEEALRLPPTERQAYNSFRQKFNI